MVLGTIVIYSVGVLGLVVVLSLTISEAVTVGAVAFLPAEALKIAAAVGIVRSDVVSAADR